MPIWMEVLLNVIGYAGFVGVATFNKSPEGAAVERHGETGVS
jgi:hypothetical protein